MGKRVLVVDDSEDLRDSIAEVLLAFGYKVLVASALDEAFEILRTRPIDVVVTDIMMGGGPSGLDLITRIRSDLGPPVPPVIACSGFPGFKQEALGRGAAAFLIKPFAMFDLRRAIEAALTGQTEQLKSVETSLRGQNYRDRSAHEAEALLRDLILGQPEFRERARWAARWAGAYLDVRHAILVGLIDGELRVQASNQDQRFPIGTSIDEHLPLCRDVLESHASLVLPDLSAFPALAAKQGKLQVRSFAAVPPLTPVGVACGALCAFDELPKKLDADDLAIMELFGRRVTQIMRQPVPRLSESAVFEVEDVLSRLAFVEVLGIELRRAQRSGGFIELGALIPSRRNRDGLWFDTISHIALGPRRALGMLDRDTLAMFVASNDPDHAARAVADAFGEVRNLLGVSGAGVVAFAGSEIPALNEHGLVYLAEMLASRSTSGHLERLVVRSEPWATSERMSAS